MDKIKVAAVVGPTASGKTALAVAIAKALGGEVISADSMQIYKHMDIGSAKIMPEEMEGVKHYLIDELEPSEEFNIVVFQKKAKAALEEIYANGQIPIVAGGTGFYIQALLYDIDFKENDEDTTYRRELEQLAKEKGAQADFDFYQKVEKLAPSAIASNRTMYRADISVNVDFYSGLLYRLLGLPEELFTPLFAIARMAGWSAHRIEELVSGGKIIRPAYKNVVKHAKYVPLKKR